LIEQISQKKLSLQVSKVYDLENAGIAHDDLETQKTTGKILLKL
jgi:NADPH:quinone reductase-like Zn-dependent oxidoreductase